jgi:hypothetical protein
MAKNKKLLIKGAEIVIIQNNTTDYISLTGLAGHKDTNRTIISFKNWLRNRNIIELLGFGEQIHNLDFNPIKFEGLKNNPD